MPIRHYFFASLKKLKYECFNKSFIFNFLLYFLLQLYLNYIYGWLDIFSIFTTSVLLGFFRFYFFPKLSFIIIIVCFLKPPWHSPGYYIDVYTKNNIIVYVRQDKLPFDLKYGELGGYKTDVIFFRDKLYYFNIGLNFAFLYPKSIELENGETKILLYGNYFYFIIRNDNKISFFQNGGEKIIEPKQIDTNLYNFGVPIGFFKGE